MRDIWLKVKQSLCWWEDDGGPKVDVKIVPKGYGEYDVVLANRVVSSICERIESRTSSYGYIYGTITFYDVKHPVTKANYSHGSLASVQNWLSCELGKRFGNMEVLFQEVGRQMGSGSKCVVELEPLLIALDLYENKVIQESGLPQLHGELIAAEQRGLALYSRWESSNGHFPSEYKVEIMDKIGRATILIQANAGKVDEHIIDLRARFIQFKQQLSEVKENAQYVVLERETKAFLQLASNVNNTVDAAITEGLRKIRHDVDNLGQRVLNYREPVAVACGVLTSDILHDQPPDYTILDKTITALIEG